MNGQLGPDPLTAQMMGAAAGLTLIGSGQLLILLLHWMAS